MQPRHLTSAYPNHFGMQQYQSSPGNPVMSASPMAASEAANVTRPANTEISDDDAVSLVDMVKRTNYFMQDAHNQNQFLSAQLVSASQQNMEFLNFIEKLMRNNGILLEGKRIVMAKYLEVCTSKAQDAQQYKDEISVLKSENENLIAQILKEKNRKKTLSAKLSESKKQIESLKQEIQNQNTEHRKKIESLEQEIQNRNADQGFLPQLESPKRPRLPNSDHESPMQALSARPIKQQRLNSGVRASLQFDFAAASKDASPIFGSQNHELPGSLGLFSFRESSFTLFNCEEKPSTLTIEQIEPAAALRLTPANLG